MDTDSTGGITAHITLELLTLIVAVICLVFFIGTAIIAQYSYEKYVQQMQPYMERFYVSGPMNTFRTLPNRYADAAL